MLMKLKMPEGQKPAIPSDLLSDAREAWREAKVDTVSKLHRDVQRVLRLLGEQPSLEHPTTDGFFYLDLAFPGTLLVQLKEKFWPGRGDSGFCGESHFHMATYGCLETWTLKTRLMCALHHGKVLDHGKKVLKWALRSRGVPPLLPLEVPLSQNLEHMQGYWARLFSSGSQTLAIVLMNATYHGWAQVWASEVEEGPS